MEAGLARLLRILPLFLLAAMAGCALFGGQTPSAVPTVSPSPASSTPTWTPSPSPTSTPSPTPTPTSTATPLGIGWSRYPNAVDFRAVVPGEEELWLAALSGLVRADLVSGEWTVWTETDGLADNTLVSLAEQGDILWIGTQRGVGRYDRSDGEWRRYTTEDGLSGDHNVHVYFDGETVWAGTRGGLSWYSPVGDRWQSVYAAAGIELSGVDGLLYDGRFLWVSVTPHAGTAGGLLRMDKASGEWTAVSRETGGPPYSSFALAQSDSALWAVPLGGLPWQYDKDSGEWRMLAEMDPDGASPGDGYVGAGFHADALWLYAPHSGELVSYMPSTRRIARHPAEPLASRQLQGQIAGHEDTLWFTGQNGLLAFDIGTGEWRTQSAGEGPPSVDRILGERECALLLRSDRDVGFWEPPPPHVDTGVGSGLGVLPAGRWQSLEPGGENEPSSVMGAVLETGALGLWLFQGSMGGLAVQGPPSLLFYSEPGAEPLRFELTPPGGWSLTEMLPQAAGDTLWFMGDRGFLSYNPAVDQWAVFELDEQAGPLSRPQQRGHVVWFVAGTQLGQFDANSGLFGLTSLPVVSSSESRLALAVGPDSLWLLVDGEVYGRGLEEGDWFLVDSAAPCLAGAHLLVFWNGALWMGGEHGIGRIELDAGRLLAGDAGEWECFSPAEGMLDAEFEQLYPTDDALWFAHSWRGLWRYVER